MGRISIKDDFEFFQEVVSHISGSLDLAESMVQVFAFLKDHFPIDGISFHQYSGRLQALKLLFLVTKDRFQYVETTLPLSENDALYMEKHESRDDIVGVSGEVSSNVVDSHRRAISHLLPYRPSSYLVGIMRSGNETLGHLCFIGSGKVRYTDTQIQRMRYLLGPFTLAMSNMLKFKRILEFQKKLYEEKNDLEKTLHHLQGNPIIGAKGGLHKTMNVVRQLEGRETPVLILGDTGTGKELIADKIQKNSLRVNGPFIKVNCGAIPESLIDSELFGYEKGAFTGATQSRPGRFEQADGGTLFLDEVGELPPQVQVRFLRVLQDGVVERLGGKQSFSVNVRIIAATNRNLETMIREGRFREDLYYRLYVFPVRLPPLRERTQDITALIHHFIEQSCARLKIKAPPVLHPESITCLKDYAWPGNVRELENLVERAVILSSDGSLQLEKLLPRNPRNIMETELDTTSMEKLIDRRIQEFHGQEADKKGDTDDLSKKKQWVQPYGKQQIQPLDETIRDSIQEALAFSRGRVNGAGGAADLLGLNPSTLRNKMCKLNIIAKHWR
jgi:transcriptional regulator with GAF, ATPase, and Fis domain